MEVRYEIDNCGHIGPMEDEVLWRYIRILADSLNLDMPVAVSAAYSKERIIFLVNEAINKLDERGRDIIRTRYGLVDSKVVTLKIIAEKHKVSVERARGLVIENLRKIRSLLHGEAKNIVVKNNYFSEKDVFKRFLKEDSSGRFPNIGDGSIFDSPIPDENKLQALLMGITTESEYMNNKPRINEEVQAYRNKEHIVMDSEDNASWLYSGVVIFGTVSVHGTVRKAKDEGKLEKTILNKEGITSIDELVIKAIGKGRHEVSKPAEFMLYEPLIVVDLAKKAQSTNLVTDIAIGEIGKKYRIDIRKTTKIEVLLKQCGLTLTNDEDVRIHEIETELEYVFKESRWPSGLIELDREYRFNVREIETLRRMAERCVREKKRRLLTFYNLEEAIVRLADIKRRNGVVTRQDIDRLIDKYRFSKTKIKGLLSIAKWEGIID